MSEEEKTEMKPCPWCGSDALLVAWTSRGDGKRYFRALCDAENPPGCAAEPLVDADSEAEAIAEWNRLHLLTALKEEGQATLRSAPIATGNNGWRPIAEAPKDETIWVWCPGVEGLKPLTSLCQWHEDAGFCVDELRTETLWHPLQPPSPPIPETENGRATRADDGATAPTTSAGVIRLSWNADKNAWVVVPPTETEKNDG